MNRKTNLVLLALIISAFLDGIITQYFKSSTLDILSIIISGVLVFTWYYFDSEEIQYKRSPFLNIGVVVIALIALPYYFFKSRGFKKGLIYTIFYILFIIAYAITQNFGSYIALYFS